MLSSTRQGGDKVCFESRVVCRDARARSLSEMLRVTYLALAFQAAERESLELDAYCPTSIPHKTCSGHGSCVSSPTKAVPQCECDRGFSGMACEVHEFALSCPYNCSWPQGGRCQNGQKGKVQHCVCASGRSGDGCVDSTPVNCSSGCAGHGECMEGVCSCFPGFYGRDCLQGCPGYVESTGQPCSGHGLCAATGSPGHSADVCKCFRGFEGDACETDVEGVTTCPLNCSGHGTCLHGLCTCEPTFASDDCSIELRHGGKLALETRLSKLLAVVACFAVSAMCASAAWSWVNAAEKSAENDARRPRMMEHMGAGMAGMRKF